jgi:hypothetical protein
MNKALFVAILNNFAKLNTDFISVWADCPLYNPEKIA